MKKAAKAKDPSRTSLGAVPEIDFGKYGRRRRNPFAKRLLKEGWALVHLEPSRASLRRCPRCGPARKVGETRTRSALPRKVSSCRSVAVGRVKSVRLPALVWKQLEEQARAEGLALHALLRTAILERLKRRGVA